MEDYWNYMQPYIITWIIIMVLAIIGFCYAGKYIAEQKGRSPTEGILFGLLGILGLVILALLPSKDKSELTEAERIARMSEDERKDEIFSNRMGFGYLIITITAFAWYLIS
jgi:hypothetical protein